MRSFFGGAVGALGAFAVLGITVIACSSSDGASPGGVTDAGTSGIDGSVDTSNPDGSTNVPNPDGGVSTTYTAFDINHVLITGQSNETGNDATTILSTAQPFTNLMFDTGPMSMQGGFKYSTRGVRGASITGCDDFGCTSFQVPTSFKPLVEGDNYFDVSYSDGVNPYIVETPASGVANEIAKLATSSFGLAKHDVLASVHGRSGNAYACLRKGGGCDLLSSGNYTAAQYGGRLNSYAQGMMEVTSAKALAAAGNKSYVVRGVVVVHGEQDSDNYFAGQPDYPIAGTDGVAGEVKDYTDALVEWQRDYETGAKAITAQTQAIPMFVSQLSKWGGNLDGRPSSVVAQMQLDAHIKAPGKVVVIGPSYPLPYNQDDCLHFTSEGERRLGEYFGKVYAQVVIGGRTWEPLRPKTITRAGATVTVQYYVPKGPLVFDTTQVTAASNMGFTLVDANGNAATAITNVALTTPDTVTLTLASDPGASKHLRYAMNREDGACVGPMVGARGNLRDSDDIVSQSGGAPLQNWGVHFDMVVP